MLIVEARAVGITFTTVDDVFSYADIPVSAGGGVRERALVILG